MTPLYTTKGEVYFSDLETTVSTDLPSGLTESQISQTNTLTTIGEVFGSTIVIGMTFLEVTAIGASMASLD